MYEYYESKKSFYKILTECCLEDNLSDLLRSILPQYFENYASCNIKAVLAEFISVVQIWDVSTSLFFRQEPQAFTQHVNFTTILFPV
jgi:hypothetical protein